MTMRGSSSAVAPAQVSQTLFVLRGADMTLTTDQAFSKLFAGTNYIITQVIGLRKTGAFGVACTGGIYTGAAKAGTALVAAAQVWSALTGASTAQPATLANILQTTVASATPNLSLTVGNTGALTADIFIVGVVVD